MEVKQPFEKDYLTNEEMITLVTYNGKIPFERARMSYGLLQEYPKIFGSVKGKTYEEVMNQLDGYFY